MVHLHGRLDVCVERAEHLPRSLRTQIGSFFKRIVCCGHGPMLYGSCDPYVVMELDGTRRLRTSVRAGETSPEWNERFEVMVADEAEKIRMVVKDADLVGAEFVAQGFLDASQLLDEECHDWVLDLTDQQGNVVGVKVPGLGEFKNAQLHFSIQYTSVDTLSKQQDALGGEVPHVYFPMRRGNLATLYRDAHQPTGPVSDIMLASGLYSERSCWEDIHATLSGAKRFILITGWSVWVETLLLRTPANAENSESLGQLLLMKASQGVKVLLLVWDDASNNLGLHPGVMATHDQETFSFFKGTPVKCVLCPRVGVSEDSLVQSVSRNAFSHHQKTIIADVPPPKSSSLPSSTSAAVRRKRHVVAYVGGLDLCNGRYDTGEHPILGTDGGDGPHRNDHHQPCFDGYVVERRGPRQPWHDVHARIEGPAAYDVMINFVERWQKQAGTRHQSEVTHLDDFQDVHFPRPVAQYLSRKAILGRIASKIHLHRSASLRPGIANPFQVKMAVIKSQDLGFVLAEGRDSWDVQIFRSIDSSSARGFGKASEGTYEAGLWIFKGKVVDASVQRAYVHAIRRAKRFIYIENQYFLGSSHLWDTDRDATAPHLVPAEIAFKICAKIKAREPFRVYVLLPLFPEGIPTSGTVQEILYFQTRTMTMMYKRIAAAIRHAGIDAQPTDYLQFFCLGKRQPKGCYTSLGCCEYTQFEAGASSGRRGAREPAAAGPKQAAAAAQRRFMVYVHSKYMVVDDEYAIIGSANINQRSMDGSRDTEIAVGLSQAGHALPPDGAGPLPRGQVAGLRLALWKEHLGHVPPEAADPSDAACMRALRRAGDNNWLAWSNDVEVEEPAGHLMTYPIAVGPTGGVGPLPGQEEFPDLGGRIVGARISGLPTILTT